MKTSSLKTALVANGEIFSYSETKQLLSSYDQVIAVDGGLFHCDQMNIKPTLIVGDLDSAPAELIIKYSHIPLLKFPVNKDHSDLELAIHEMFQRGINQLALFGVLGRRTDHLLYMLYILARFPERLRVISESETIFALQKNQVLEVIPGQTLSLIPLGIVTGLTTQGLKWEINDKLIDKQFMSLSNICNHTEISIRFESGDLICCIQK